MAEEKPDQPDDKTEQAVRDIAGQERDRAVTSEREAVLPESVLREPQRVRHCAGGCPGKSVAGATAADGAGYGP